MLKDAKRVGVYGGSGSGKSTFVKNYIKGNNRIVIFDPQREYDVKQRFDNLVDVKNHLAANWNIGFRIAITPAPHMADKEPELLHKLAVLLRHCQQPYADEQDSRKITLLVEEIQLSYPSAKLPAKLNGFSYLCTTGRHYGIEIIAVTQRPAQVSTTFRGNTTQNYYFRLLNSTDIKAVGEVMGAKAKRLADLKTHQYIAFGDIMGEGMNKLKRNF